MDVDLLYLTLMCEWGHLLGLTDTEMVGPSLSGISFVHFRMFFTQDWDDQIIQGIGVGLKKKNHLPGNQKAFRFTFTSVTN